MAKSSKSWADAKLLLVEDNAIQKKLIMAGFKKVGIQENNVTYADDGAMALEIFAKDPSRTFDLVISDQNMPNMVGSKFIQALRKLDYHGAIVGNSSVESGIETSGEGAKELMLSAGADAFYDKSMFIGIKAITTLNQIAEKFLPDIDISSKVGVKLEIMGKNT